MLEATRLGIGDGASQRLRTAFDVAIVKGVGLIRLHSFLAEGSAPQCFSAPAYSQP